MVPVLYKERNAQFPNCNSIFTVINLLFFNCTIFYRYMTCHYVSNTSETIFNGALSTEFCLNIQQIFITMNLLKMFVYQGTRLVFFNGARYSGTTEQSMRPSLYKPGSFWRPPRHLLTLVFTYCCVTLACYLSFLLNLHILFILLVITSYCSLRYIVILF